MENHQTTIDSIMHYFQKLVLERKPQPPEEWMRAAMSINVLKGVEYDELAELEMQCNKFEMDQIVEHDLTSARAKTFLRASELYKRYNQKRARVNQIEEFIRLAKKNATLITDQMKNVI
jgi:hypothetical protein